ncbi:methionine--tRNA ligase, chloroplastic/mitochondrial [Selaginella moellendorffii]|nr:methionine--tRNA ligase, chloroplastic/mitochondrial [Selaginella moellendorffii]|eukprot:XP_002981032.2 methionine--tRNA ligase, chloroplastic/mitochondrial [Selaginella moellendorffii]
MVQCLYSSSAAAAPNLCFSLRCSRWIFSRSAKSAAARRNSAAFTSVRAEKENDRDGRTFVVTTPLYYVNAAPHMGSAYPTIAADAFARFQRLQGRNVVFVTGTDEHGEKIATAAAAKGRKPKEHCDLIANEYASLWKDLNISYDKFIRTTDEAHERAVEQFYKRVYDKEDIYCANYEGLYCVNCEEYKDAKDLIEEHCCPIHRKPCVERKEKNYFFALSKYQSRLEELLSTRPAFVRPPFRMNEVLGWVKEGLHDFSISREAVEWGIPVPTDKKQTIYVWFDALLGYISALLDGKEVTPENAAASGWPASVHIIGKDILRFHAVYWPAMLWSAGFAIPETVFGHGFLTKDGLKMGKSLGNTIEPQELVSRFGVDSVRYFFLNEMEFGRDGDYSEERFITIVNAHLANTIGNLLNRTLGLLKKNCASTISVDSESIPEENPVRVFAEAAVARAKRRYSELHFSSACEALLSLANTGNAYLEERAPWTGFKQKATPAAEAAAKDLAVILESVRILSVALSPVVPDLCKRMWLQLGYQDEHFNQISWDDTRWGGLKAGQLVATPSPVFPKIEAEVADSSLAKAAV